MTNSQKKLSLEQFPGGLLVERGLEDACSGRITPESLLVSICSIWMRENGLGEGFHPLVGEPEIALYHQLEADPNVPNPYGRYNSMLRELVSFQRAWSLNTRCSDKSPCH